MKTKRMKCIISLLLACVLGFQVSAFAEGIPPEEPESDYISVVFLGRGEEVPRAADEPFYIGEKIRVGVKNTSSIPMGYYGVEWCLYENNEWGIWFNVYDEDLPDDVDDSSPKIVKDGNISVSEDPFANLVARKQKYRVHSRLFMRDYEALEGVADDNHTPQDGETTFATSQEGDEFSVLLEEKKILLSKEVMLERLEPLEYVWGDNNNIAFTNLAPENSDVKIEVMVYYDYRVLGVNIGKYTFVDVPAGQTVSKSYPGKTGVRFTYRILNDDDLVTFYHQTGWIHD